MTNELVETLQNIELSSKKRFVINNGTVKIFAARISHEDSFIEIAFKQDTPISEVFEILSERRELLMKKALIKKLKVE